MFKTTSPLSGLMPYGAPELLESARPFLLRAVMLGSALWTAVFLVLLATGGWRSQPTLPLAHVVYPGPYVIPPILPLEPRIESGHVKRSPTHGTVVPVRSDAIDAKVEDEPPVTADPGDVGTTTGPPLDAGTHDRTDVPDGVIQAPPHTYDPWQVDELPVARRIVEPAYPDLAREAQVEGLVVVRARVDSTGRVDQVEIERSVPLLDQAALDAARKFRFDPARVGRHPVAVWVQLPFRFKLH